jgi:hypothetical protein
VKAWVYERPYIVLRMDDKLRTLDLYGHADRWGELRVEPSWYPCQEGQIKGNKNSKIYHISTGKSYNKTFREVTCFSTAAEAKAAGFRAAGN